ncbi:MAG: hypothetical protein KC978_19500 [Candidatus Omnitrophica bacterium]|nr:hypothetical protein [Candidatus Omnitrophota bacterium]
MGFLSARLGTEIPKRLSTGVVLPHRTPNNSLMPQIRPIAPENAPAWLALRCALWPEGSESEHREEIEAFFAGGLYPSGRPHLLKP